MTDNINAYVRNLPFLSVGRIMACLSMFYIACSLRYILLVLPPPEILNLWKTTQTGNWQQKKIEELQMIVKFQEARISSLENRCKEPVDKVTELERSLKKQSVLITQLEARVDEFEALLKIENDALAKHARLANSKHHSSIFKNSISPVRIGKCKRYVIFSFKKQGCCLVYTFFVEIEITLLSFLLTTKQST